jgi:hypothetical protein
MSHPGPLPAQTLTPAIRVTFGPAPCHDCGEPLVFGRRIRGVGFEETLQTWMEPDGTPHVCTPKPREVVPVDKMCGSCRRVLPLSAFGWDCHRPSGRNARCKPCAREAWRVSQGRARRLANRTSVRLALVPTPNYSYDSAAGSSSESASIADDARALATTRDMGVAASTEVVAR